MTLIRVPYRGGFYHGIEDPLEPNEANLLDRQGSLKWVGPSGATAWDVYRLKKTKDGWVNVFLGTVDKLGELPVKQ